MDKQYDSMTLANLRELAKEKGLKNITSLKKSELIESLMRDDTESSQGEKREATNRTEQVPAEKINTEKAQERKRTGHAGEKHSVAEEPKIEQPVTEQVKAEQIKAEQIKAEQIKAEHSKIERTRTEQSRTERSRTEQSRTDRLGTERPRTERPRTEQPRTDQPRLGQQRSEQSRTEQSRTEQIRAEQPRTESPRTEQSRTEQSRAEQPRAEQPRSEQPRPEQLRSEQPQQAEQFSEQSQTAGREDRKPAMSNNEMDQLDSGETKVGILEVLPDGYGFIRCDNYLPGENDVYVSPAQIRRFNLKTGDIVSGNTRIRSQNEKFSALLYVKSVNGFHPAEAQKRKRFEDLTPIFPNERIHLETLGTGVSMRMVDLISPIGKGQRGMIVSQPKTGKTTLLKQIAKAVTNNHPDMKLIILLIDERPEEVTDIKESIEGRNVEVIYSTFDELPDNHKRVSEMVIERAKRLVEHKQDVIILLDSITRLARAYNLTVQPSGRTLSGGLDPAALHMPKKFFGAARNMREGGSLTILATALVDTGSRMDDVVFEEFKGTGNMELVLDRSLSEKRIFPAIDLPRSSTRREDLLLTQPELEATYLMRKALGGLKSEEALERIIDMFLRTKTNVEFIETIKKTKIVF